MSLELCPLCNSESLIKVLQGQKMVDKFGSLIHFSNSYLKQCLNKECDYKTEKYEVKTEFGERQSSPWYKRIFK